MLVPTVHLNGTSGEVLTGNIDIFLQALFVVQNAWGECQPNGRDYYPQGEAAISSALTDWRRIADSLTAIRREVYDLKNAMREAGR